MNSSHWPVSLHSRFEGVLVGVVAAFHGLDRSPDRDRRGLDDAIQAALTLASSLGHGDLGSGDPSRDDRGGLATTLATTAGPGDRLAIALLPLMVRWFDRPDTWIALWEQATHQPVPEAVAFGAIIVGRSMIHDSQSLASLESLPRILTPPTPDRLWELAANPLADWQASDRHPWDWPQRLRFPHSDSVPLLVALHSTISSGGRWHTALARSQQHSASAALWTGALVGALGGVAAIPALYGAMIPDSTLAATTDAAQRLIDQWSGRLPSLISDRSLPSLSPGRRASGPPFNLRPVVRG